MNSPTLTLDISTFYSDLDEMPWLCRRELEHFYSIGRAQKLQITSHRITAKDRVHIRILDNQAWTHIDETESLLHFALFRWCQAEVKAGRPYFQLWIIE